MQQAVDALPQSAKIESNISAMWLQLRRRIESPDMEQYNLAAKIATNLLGFPCTVLVYNENTGFRFEGDLGVVGTGNLEVYSYIKEFNKFYESTSDILEGGHGTKLNIFDNLIAAMYDFAFAHSKYASIDMGRTTRVITACRASMAQANAEIEKANMEKIRKS